ncbi:MAG: helix-turn-helix domain-containing protein [Ignavibacteriaceae bacterium]|jgi:y4mF family transcriptional regulator|nr:helix-turn-helix domain-containing protein [Ignavibacteriaceae bacterium]
MTLSEIIKYHRKKSGLTQKQLAELAEVGKTLVFDLEKGKTSIQFDKIQKILGVLNIKFHFDSPLLKQRRNKHESN